MARRQKNFTSPRLMIERLSGRRWLLVGLSLAVLSGAPTLASTEASTKPADLGLVVSTIELRLDAPLGRRLDVEPLLAVRVGETLTEQGIRRTLQNLQATGLFSEAEILTRRDEATSGPTVTAIVVLRSQAWVAKVELRGPRQLEDRALLRVVRQKEASPLSEERILESVYALKDLYIERGFREAMVRVAVEPRGHAQELRVVFHLDSGPKARVTDVVFEGNIAPRLPSELETTLRCRDGARYDRVKVDGDVRRLRAYLARLGHLSARVDMPRETYDAATDSMVLTYPINVGPTLDVEVTGASLKSLKRKGFLPFLDDEILDDASLERQCERIKDSFQRRGHYRVEARCSLEDSRLLIDLEPGKKYLLRSVRFEGNTQIASEDLERLIGTSTYNKWKPGSGRLVATDLDADLDNLRSYYLLQGFGDAEIPPPTVLVDGQELTLTFKIREGKRQRLVDFTFSGIELFDLDEVRSTLPLTPGGPFHPALLDDSLNIIRALYEDEGYPTVTVQPNLDWNAEDTLVDVHVRVEEGLQSVVDRILLRGQRHTKTQVLQRLIDLEEGDPISRRRLLEVERDLYRLGIFSKVDIEQRSVSESSDRRDVVVRLEEGRRYRLAYGFSYHSEDGLGGLWSITRSNIGGRGDRFQFDARGNKNDSRFRLLYDQPRLGRWNLPITYSIFGQEENRDAFSVNSTGAQIAVTQDLPSVRLRAVAEYRLVEITEQTEAFPNLDPFAIDREDREVEIFSLIPILYIDRRDDPLDPARGWTTALQLEYALPLIDADTHFLKLFWQQTQYWPLGRAGGFAASFRLGAIEPLDQEASRDPLVPPELPSSLVPVSERFFAGGRTSHRAYDRDELGIRGQTLIDAGNGAFVEIGGNGLALLNLDYRFPIAGPIGGIVFFDYGNVWADYTDMDFTDLKPGAGLGVRYTSPIGPVRFEIGWKLDAEPFEDNDPVFFLSFGNPF